MLDGPLGLPLTDFGERLRLKPAGVPSRKQPDGGRPRGMIKPDRKSRSRGFGEVPGVHAGQRFHRRTDLRTARVHLQPGRGIDACRDGARSIVFSGGYVDDVWDSENPIYTGEGGRDQQGRQVRDQIMVRGNLALRKNMERENSRATSAIFSVRWRP